MAGGSNMYPGSAWIVYFHVARRQRSVFQGSLTGGGQPEKTKLSRYGGCLRAGSSPNHFSLPTISANFLEYDFSAYYAAVRIGFDICAVGRQFQPG